jgi:lipopolysaccharide export system protein LptA
MISKPPFIFGRTFLLLLLIAAFYLKPSQIHAQERVQIVRADSIAGVTIDGERIQKILGDVLLQSEDLTMYADSAYQFVEDNEIRAFNNIEINTEEENIWADSLTYFTDVDFTRLRGRVIIENPADTTTLFSNAVDYRFSSKVAHFIEEVRLEDNDGVLRADSGYYYQEPDSAIFRGQVQLADSVQYAEGDSLFINRKTNFSQLYGDLYLDDLENEVRLKGEFLEADSTGKRTLEENAWMMDFSSDTTETDTTHIQSAVIISRRDITDGDTTNTVDAYENVRIWSPKFSAIADSARYTDSTEVFELWSNPSAWHKDIQLTGPHINVYLKDGEVHRLYAYPNPISVQVDTVINRFHQMTGDTLIANFEEGEINQIRTFENAQILRYNKNEEDEPDGAIEVLAPLIVITFREGEPHRLKGEGENEGSYLPESEQTSERRLDGYTWTPDQRPQRPAEEMEPRFAPITNLFPFDLPRRYREHLLREGRE